MISSAITVGIAGPLTGERSAHAPLLHRACTRLRLAGVIPVLLDDQADPATAVRAAHRFVASGVSAVIGHFNSACADATRWIYRDAGISLMLPASSKSGLTDLEGVFRLCPTDAEQARLLWRSAAGIPRENVEIVVDGSPYSDRLLEKVLAEINSPDCLHVVQICDEPASSVRVRLVLATCEGAIRAHRTMCEANWSGVAIFSDDAHIGAFIQSCIDNPGLVSYVVAANGGFERSVDLACDLVSKAIFTRGTKSISEWLHKCGLFSDQGELLDTHWTLLPLQSSGQIKNTFNHPLPGALHEPS